MMRRYVTLVLGFALFALSGCVGKKKYDAVVQDREQLKKELAKTQQQAEKTKEELNSKIEARDKRIEKLEKKVANLEKEKKQTEEELKKAKGTLEMYEDETGSLQEKLDATKDELATLRKKQREQEKRLQRYRDLAKRLAETFKSEQLSVKVRNGKMVIEMRDNVLFNSGSAKVKDDGKKVLEELANVLQDISDREFLVAGHTDNVPISSGRFEDNWELSTTRAANVVRYLKEKGVSPEQLSAAGYSKFDPVADNSTEEGKAKNRRIEIVLMPKVSELPNLPKDLFEGQQG